MLRVFRNLLPPLFRRKLGEPPSVIEIGGVQLPLQTNNPHEAKYHHSPRDTVDYAIASHLQLTGKRVIDLGANIGLTALYYLEMGATMVHAVEPDPRLAKRIRALASDKLLLLEAAVSDSVGKMTLYLSDGHNQGNSLNPEWLTLFPTVFKKNQSTTVQVTTLDSAFGDEHFDFIKIDVEGVEVEVLRGGRQFFANNANSIVQIELYDEIFAQADSILSDVYSKSKRVVYRDEAAILLAPDSETVATFEHAEKNPPIYLYANSFPESFRTID